jgi:hypothetical protein
VEDQKQKMQSFYDLDRFESDFLHDAAVMFGESTGPGGSKSTVSNPGNMRELMK